MAFSNGNSTITLEDIKSKVSESNILAFYLNIYSVPCVINSPLREDKNPSFGLYSKDGNKIYYKDLSTNESGDLYDLLMNLWHCDFKYMLSKIAKDLNKMTSKSTINKYKTNVQKIAKYHSNSNIECKVREWRDYDLEYWKSYGISLPWLKYAEIYPISHKIIIKDNNRFILGADKYAYVYVEHKEDKVTLKIYQPFNKLGYKWSSKHDNSVISLWTKIPKYGDKLCICASVKDSLCLWANTNIPSVSPQGEGYRMSNTAINELKRRFKHVYILFDNDEAGLMDGVKLAEQTGFTNIVLPKEYGEKDISDLYKSLQDKQKFKEILINLF